MEAQSNFNREELCYIDPKLSQESSVREQTHLKRLKPFPHASSSLRRVLGLRALLDAALAAAHIPIFDRESFPKQLIRPTRRGLVAHEERSYITTNSESLDAFRNESQVDEEAVEAATTALAPSSSSYSASYVVNDDNFYYSGGGPILAPRESERVEIGSAPPAFQCGSEGRAHRSRRKRRRSVIGIVEDDETA